jgi:hypothetical protein
VKFRLLPQHSCGEPTPEASGSMNCALGRWPILTRFKELSSHILKRRTCFRPRVVPSLTSVIVNSVRHNKGLDAEKGRSPSPRTSQLRQPWLPHNTNWYATYKPL